MNSFIVKVSCNYTPIIDLMLKDKNYLNELFMHSDSPFYLEFIHDGFLLIMKNVSAFKKMRDRERLEEKIIQSKKQLGMTLLKINKIFDSVPYPKKGVTFIVECQNIYQNMLYRILKENFAQIHPDIQVKMNKAGHTLIDFTTFETIELYSLIINAFTEELESEIIAYI
jgi:hypothetical protein